HRVRQDYEFSTDASPIPTNISGALFFFSSRRRHTRCYRDWSSDVCSSDLPRMATPSASFPPSPAAVVVVNLPDPVSPLSSLESRSESFSVPFFDILEESRRAGNRNGYNHSTEIGRASCRERM